MYGLDYTFGLIYFMIVLVRFWSVFSCDFGLSFFLWLFVYSLVRLRSVVVLEVFVGVDCGPFRGPYILFLNAPSFSCIYAVSIVFLNFFFALPW